MALPSRVQKYKLRFVTAMAPFNYFKAYQIWAVKVTRLSLWTTKHVLVLYQNYIVQIGRDTSLYQVHYYTGPKFF